MTRAERRANDKRIKAKAERKVKQWGMHKWGTPATAPAPPVNPALVGKQASVHGTCPCEYCTEKKPENKGKHERDFFRFYREEL